MIDVSVALAWVAISGVSLRWLSMLSYSSQLTIPERETPECEGELLHEDLYPREFAPFYIGGPR